MLGRKIEFAADNRVLAAIRQGDHAFVANIAALGPETVCALVDPVLAFFFRKLVEIENGFPLRRVTGITFQRCPTPQTAHMRFVLPEIVDHPVTN